MQIRWLGTAGLLLRHGGCVLAFDPFGGIYPGDLKHPPQKLAIEESCQKADRVFVTHGHIDHIYHLPKLYKGGETPIYCTDAPRRTLLREGIPEKQLHCIAPGWQGRAGAFSVQAFQGRHCKFDFPLIVKTVASRRLARNLGRAIRFSLEMLRFPEKGEILFYEVGCENLRVQIMGSMNLDPATRYPAGADVLVLPFQGRSDFADYAMGIVRKLKPRTILLDHYDDTFPPLTSLIDTTAFCETVEREFGIKCQALRQGEPIEVETYISEKRGEIR